MDLPNGSGRSIEQHLARVTITPGNIMSLFHLELPAAPAGWIASLAKFQLFPYPHVKLFAHEQT